MLSPTVANELNELVKYLYESLSLSLYIYIYILYTHIL